MKLASIDVGLKRIGLALNLESSIISPMPAILRKNRHQASKEVCLFLQTWEIEKLIVGYPKSSEEMQIRIKHFISLLNLKIPYVFVNEDMSSVEAKEQMKGITKQKKDGKIDSFAAKIILQRYLDSKV